MFHSLFYSIHQSYPLSLYCFGPSMQHHQHHQQRPDSSQFFQHHQQRPDIFTILPFRPNRIVLPPVSCVCTIEAWLISLWQQLPSSMKQTKSKVKSFIMDGHIEQSWCLVTTSIKANIEYLV